MRSIQVEQFHPSRDISFDISIYERLDSKNPNLFKIHEDYELTALYNCSGKRIVGNSINNFSNGDLFLLGPNLPHLIRVDKPEESKAVCIHFKEDSFGTDFFKKAQNQTIFNLLKKASLGCTFFGREVALLKKEMLQIQALDGFNKMILFLNILNRLAKTTNYELLSSPGYNSKIKAKDGEQVSVIYDYIIENFHRKLSIEELSELIHVSPSTFGRHFKKSMNKNFSDFLTEVRIGHACKLLIESDRAISEIAYLSGYQNITHFNRQFKKLTQVTPRSYRKNSLS